MYVTVYAKLLVALRQQNTGECCGKRMFLLLSFVQADCGIAGNINKTNSDEKLRALQVAISLLTSVQNFCYPT